MTQKNHCGYLIILDLAKSPFVNMILRQNVADTKVLTLRLDLSLAKSKTLREYQPRSIWLLLATYDIKLECTRIPGKDHVKADILSRVFERGLINGQLFDH